MEDPARRSDRRSETRANDQDDAGPEPPASAALASVRRPTCPYCDVEMRRGRRRRWRPITALPIIAGLILCLVAIVPVSTLVGWVESLLGRGEGYFAEHPERTGEVARFAVDRATALLPPAGLVLLLLGAAVALWPKRLWLCPRCRFTLPRTG